MSTNIYFSWTDSASRFAPYTQAKAEDINTTFDLVSYGFDLVQASLALKAPLASPTFTGTVTVPAPPSLGDNSTKAATTAWVQSLVGSLTVGLPSQTGHVDQMLSTDGTSATWSSGSYLHVRDQKASGTDGGTSSTGHQVRVLNTVVTNTISGASLASNLVTLPAGTYYAQGYATYFNQNVGLTKLAIYNSSDSTDLIIGSTHQTYVSVAEARVLTVAGRFTLATSKNVSLRHWMAVGFASTGLGLAASTGQVEVYAELLLWKVG